MNMKYRIQMDVEKKDKNKLERIADIIFIIYPEFENRVLIVDIDD